MSGWLVLTNFKWDFMEFIHTIGAYEWQVQVGLDFFMFMFPQHRGHTTNHLDVMPIKFYNISDQLQYKL